MPAPRPRALVLLALGLAACAGGTAPPPRPAAPAPARLATASAVAPSPVAPPAPPPGPPEPGLISVTDADPSVGDPLALVTLVAFADLADPRAWSLAPVLRSLEDRYGPRKLRVVWKAAPSPARTGSRPRALAALAAMKGGGPKAFWALHDLAVGPTSLAGIEIPDAWAVAAGMAPERLRALMESPEVVAKLEADTALARGLAGTRELVVYVDGLECSRRTGFVWSDPKASLERLSVVIDDELGRARSALVEGTPPERIYATRTKDNLAQPRRLPDSLATDPEAGVFDVPIDDSPVRGPRTALVTIVEFADFQCPFSQRVQVTLREVARIYKDDVRIVFKNNALPFHPRAEPAAELAMEALAQKGEAAFWRVHDALWDSQRKLETPDLLRIAVAKGLAAGKVATAVASRRHRAAIEADAGLARTLRANGTPSFFVNGRRLAGAQPLAKFRELIDEELASASDLVARGVRREDVYDEIRKGAITLPPAPPPPPPSRPSLPLELISP